MRHFLRGLVGLVLVVAMAVQAAPPVNPFVPPGAAALFGQYREGEFPVPQQFIGADQYIGFAWGQPFRPFYVVEQAVPLIRLPMQVHCCGLSIAQLQAGAVDVVHVYLDARPGGGSIVGPVESLIQTADGVMVISAPYIGRRAVRVR